MLLISIALLAVAVGFYQMQMKSFPIDYQQVPGKVYVITGANSGLGYETAKEIARNGGHVVMGCRDLKRGGAAKEKLIAELALVDGKDRSKNVEVLPLDLASFASIRDFVHLLQTESKITKVDALINNAGIMALPTRTLTVDGLEAQIGTNHFGHFLLTMLIWPILASNARIVNHSSVASTFHDGKFPFSNVQSESSYDPWTAYGNSKVANLLFNYALEAKIKELPETSPHKNIEVYAVHPGYSATNLQTDRFPLYDIANSLFAMTASEGALSQIYAAVDPRAPTQTPPYTYIGPFFVSFGPPRAQAPFTSLVTDKVAQETLWNISVQVTGVDLPTSTSA